MLNVLHKETTGKDVRLGDVHIPLRDVNFFNPQKISYDLADLVSFRTRTLLFLFVSFYGICILFFTLLQLCC